MMAHDSQLGRPRLDDATVQRLTSTLNEYLATNSEPDSLQLVLRATAAEAQQKGMHAEDLLIVLKDCWNALDTVLRRQDSEDHARQLQRVVTLCIQEYYAN